MVRTDLVGVYVNICPPPQRNDKGRRGSGQVLAYLDSSSKRAVKENFVVIDTNKRDLLYCLWSNAKQLRYTQAQREMETKKKTARKLDHCCRYGLTTIRHHSLAYDM